MSEHAGTYVAEYERLPSGNILYRVVHAGEPGILYVEADPSGHLEATTFHGRRIQDIPPAAREAVISYHAHRHSGQTLHHAHSGGDEPHNYFGHPEDIPPAGVTRSRHGLFGPDDRI